MTRSIKAVGVLFLSAFLLLSSIQYAQAQTLIHDGTGGNTQTGAVFLGEGFLIADYPTCGTLPNWVVTRVDVLLNGSGSPDTVLSMKLWNGSTEVGRATSTNSNVIGNGGLTMYQYNFANIDIQQLCAIHNVMSGSPTYLFQFEVVKTGGTSLTFQYSSGDEITGARAYFQGGNFGSADLNFDVYGYDLEGGVDTSTRVIENISPANISTTPTTFVSFEYDYYFNDTTHLGVLDQACVEISDTTVSQQVVPSCESIVASGESTFSEGRVLTSGHTYLWRPYLTSSTTEVGRIYGDWWSFAVVSGSATQDLLPIVDDNATSTLTSVFGALPSYFFGKIPFVWIFQIWEAITDAQEEDDNMSLPVYTLSLDGGSVPISVEFLSASSTETYLGQDTLDLIRLLLAAVLWFAFFSEIAWVATHLWGQT